MFLDDSACNLASINLVKFMDDEGKFDVGAFRHTVDLFILAQEILVSLSSYPSRAIATNSHEFRPLGLGYANIGAYLMRIGLPYDSDPGRALTAAITAIMTGRAYAQSARIAKQVGTFAKHEPNRESMLEVIGMHKGAAYELDAQNLEGHMFEAAKEDWDEAYDLGEKYGFRNAQVTVLAPTGTIGPLMDADTTGIEPDFALVKYKKLAGGSGYSIVNQSVAPALERMGYTEEETKTITDYVLAKGKIEGAPALKEEHLVVFDCANRCADGVRFIRPMAHVEMMAAVQPFISGAISKTVNMPEEVTVEDVEQIYIESWKRGLKALALYRDNCKASQPLTSKKEEKAKVEAKGSSKIVLPKTRQGVTHQFTVGGHKIYLIANTDAEGRLGEIFIRSSKEGSMVGGLLNTIAKLLSKTLQNGESVEALIDSMMNMRFEPWGATDDNEIPFAKSIPDYIGRWLGRRFLSLQKQVMLGIIGEDVAKTLKEAEDETVEVDEVVVPEAKMAVAEKPEPIQSKLDMGLSQNGDVVESSAPPCPTCGALMVRNGTCYACRECGTTTGCS
jgi:ribonucleoside-diphosphate reductase alpha chain